MLWVKLLNLLDHLSGSTRAAAEGEKKKKVNLYTHASTLSPVLSNQVEQICEKLPVFSQCKWFRGLEYVVVGHVGRWTITLDY